MFLLCSVVVFLSAHLHFPSKDLILVSSVFHWDISYNVNIAEGSFQERESVGLKAGSTCYSLEV